MGVFADMLRNYLIIAIRNLFRHKLYSFINISGLAVGIAFCILVLLFVRYEWSFDTFHEDVERIFLMQQIEKGIDEDYYHGEAWVRMPLLFKTALLEDFPEIERVVRIYPGITKGTDVHYGDKVSFDQSGLYADPAFFEMFSFFQVSGDLKTALRELNSVVISRAIAHRYFEDEDPIGKFVSIRTSRELENFTITGVVDVPDNSSIQFDFVLSLEKVIQEGKLNPAWDRWNYYTFVQLPEQLQASDLENRFPPFAEACFGKWIEWRREDYNNYELHLKLFPLRDIHSNLRFVYDLGPTTDPVYSYLLSGIALSVLLMACVNFMNLSLGLSSTRFREVGMRKVLGARRAHLVKQFGGEAVLLSFLALFLGIALSELLLPTFNGLIHKELTIDYGSTWLVLLTLVLFTGLIAGSYPVLVLSGFHPVEVLKGQLRFGGSNRFTRGLVVVQFALSLIMVIATLIMSAQMHYLKTKKLGFNTEQLVVIDTNPVGLLGLANEEKERLLYLYQRQAAQYDDIINVSMVNGSFGRDGLEVMGDTHEGRKIDLCVLETYYDYLEVLGIPLIEGRTFSRNFPSDARRSVLVNETLVQEFGPRAVIGERVPAQPENRWLDREIIGVVGDFHIRTWQYEISPTVIVLAEDPRRLRYILVKINLEDIPAMLSMLEETWRQIVPDYPFLFSFLDADVERTFREDERWLKIIRYSALFGIFIACLGAFGLSSLMVARRTKEIGIRRVLGASAISIVSLLSREFVWQMVVSSFLAFPVSYFAISRWLQSFAYRIDLGIGVFVLTLFACADRLASTNGS